MSPDFIGGAAPEPAMCEERMGVEEWAATQRDLAHRLSGEGTPLTSSRTFYAEWEVEPGHWWGSFYTWALWFSACPCHSSVKYSFMIPYCPKCHGSTPGPASLIWLLSPLVPFQHTACSQIPLGAPVTILICSASSLTCYLIFICSTLVYLSWGQI